MNSLLRATGYHELKSHFKESPIQGEKKLRVKIVMPLHQVDSFQVLTFSAGEKLVLLQEKIRSTTDLLIHFSKSKSFWSTKPPSRSKELRNHSPWKKKGKKK